MLATVVVVVATHNLAFGVLTGMLIASLNFATKVARFITVRSSLESNTRICTVTGKVFFASADRFTRHFDFQENQERVVINVTFAHFWDITSINALDRIVIKFRREGAKVEIRDMNDATRTLIDRFGAHDKHEKVERLMGGHEST